MSKLRISKKQAEHLAYLINSCAAWTLVVERNIADGKYKEVRKHMDTHDKAGKELNELLGTTAVQLYHPEAA